MKMYIAEQTILFLQSLLVGAALGILYEPFRILRAALKTPTWLLFAEDISYLLIAAFITFSFMLSEEAGKIRFILLIGEGIGLLLYLFTIGEIVSRITGKTVKVLMKIIKWVWEKGIAPVFRLFTRPMCFFLKKIKKNLKNSKIYLQVDSDIVYNQYVSVFPFKKKIIGTRIRMKSKPKNQKKTNLKRILLRCGLIVFGVYAAYSFVTYQYELAQKQRELEEIKQQCVEVKLENTELERLLAQKDSTDYLEKLAREKLGYGYENEIFYVDISGN